MASLHLLTLLLLMISLNSATSDDVSCLQSLKHSIQDPENRLSSWDFTSTSAGTICKFDGVVCWNDHENRLYKLQLNQFHLSGQIPLSSLQSCSSNLEFVDLSGNSFSGSLNSSICNSLPYIVSIDFSNNLLSGQIPADLSDCQYLNKLDLSNNRLIGEIPSEFASLTRLSTFSVANNRLSGQIPSGLGRFDESSFAGNGNLCGTPAGRCGRLSKRNLAIIVSAGVFGAVASLMLGLGFWYFRVRRGKKGYGIGSGDDSGWVERLKAHRLVQVSLFQKPIVKLKLADLLAATNGFSQENVMFSTRLGTTYKAVLPDGSALAVKRLSGCRMSEKLFRVEMSRLGGLRHPNLVTLLGFCVVEDERLLVYKHMCNGSLYSLLHDEAMALDWPARFQICLSVARGLAWLHHGNKPACLHRSVNSSVVLLDEDLDARLVDFELAGLVTNASGDKESGFVNGSLSELGYIAPEYSNAATTVASSLKGDVYAFGVILLEVITRRKPIEVGVEEDGYKGNLVEWVKRLSASGRISEAIDRDVFDKGHNDDVLRVLQIACGCVASQPKDRLSMYQAYESLYSMSDEHETAEPYDDFPLIPFGDDNGSPV